MLTKFTSIAFYIDETQKNTKLAHRASAIARRHGAHLIAVYCASADARYAEGFARGDGIEATLTALQHRHEQKAVEASRYLTNLSIAKNISIELRIVWDLASIKDLSVHSLHCDLVMLSHPHPSYLQHILSAESNVLAGGTPILLIPEEWKGADIGTRVVVAWNGSQEAKRGINDAMPFIANAEWVKVLVVDAEEHASRHGQEPGADIGLYLARHGAHVDVECVDSGNAGISRTISDYVRDCDANLLVIGAYSRSRLAERILGGVTRELMGEASMPILLSR
ncbi:universal stress protein [Pseudomonas aeruginosa]|uniref:universal stress protein n=1 Tax=Pseudomonas aeruginosa TaxID=287 RepID=UPI00053ED198|nr:universal stress protein [Pseudomonas aeruginosa]HBN9494412.1 universal stress protein [Pseudomonas aeruginosa]